MLYFFKKLLGTSSAYLPPQTYEVANSKGNPKLSDEQCARIAKFVQVNSKKSSFFKNSLIPFLFL
jgi:uncharacterized protein (DUF2384 family)